MMYVRNVDKSNTITVYKLITKIPTEGSSHGLISSDELTYSIPCMDNNLLCSVCSIRVFQRYYNSDMTS